MQAMSDQIGDEAMDVDESSQAEQQEDTESEEEQLEDGTIHKIKKIHSQKVRHIKKHIKVNGNDFLIQQDVIVPGTEKDKVVEVFEDPPKFQTVVEDIDQPTEDGHVVKRHVVHNRMVRHVKTRETSIDQEKGEQKEEYEIDEIVPGTESSFIECETSSDEDDSHWQQPGDLIIYNEKKGDGRIIHHHKEVHPDSTYVDEIEERGVPVEKRDLEDFEEILPDGTVHHKQVLHTHKVRKVVKHIESEDKDVPIFEGVVEVPDTSKHVVISDEIIGDVASGGGDPNCPADRVAHRQICKEMAIKGGVNKVESSAFDLLDSKKIQVKSNYDETSDILDDGSRITHRHAVIEEVSTGTSRSGSPEIVRDQIVVHEEELAPSPRCSPFGSVENLTESDLRENSEDFVLRQVKKSELSETFTDDQVQEDYTAVRHTYERRQLSKLQTE